MGAWMGWVYTGLVLPVRGNLLLRPQRCPVKQTHKRIHRHILLVDDDRAHRSFLERWLRYEGYRVRSAEGGQQGLELARQEPPDLILLDVMMPRMNGFQVVEALQAEGLRVPILFLSANDEPETLAQAAQLGVPLLVKPVLLDELLARMAQALHPKE